MTSFLWFCHALKKTFRPSSLSKTALSFCFSKCMALIAFVFISVKIKRSPKIGLNSSIKSNASEVRPGLSPCINPTYASNPTLHKAFAHSPANIVYANDKIAFTLSNGGLRFLVIKEKSSFWFKIKSWKTEK